MGKFLIIFFWLSLLAFIGGFLNAWMKDLGHDFTYTIYSTVGWIQCWIVHYYIFGW